MRQSSQPQGGRATFYRQFLPTMVGKNCNLTAPTSLPYRALRKGERAGAVFFVFFGGVRRQKYEGIFSPLFGRGEAGDGMNYPVK